MTNNAGAASSRVMIDGYLIDIDALIRDHDAKLDELQNVLNMRITAQGTETSVIDDFQAAIEQLQEAVNGMRDRNTIIATEPIIERYARVNITKGAKGDYRHETTVTVTMTGGDWTALQEELCAGLRAADGAARIEIEQRIGWDQHPHESDERNDEPF